MTIRPLSHSATPLRIALAAAVCLLLAAPLWAATREYVARAGIGADTFKAWLEKNQSQGFVPICVNGYDANGHAEFSGLVVKPDEKGTAYETRLDMTKEEVQEATRQMGKKGFYPYSLSSYLDGKSPRFAAVWTDAKRFATAMKFRYALTMEEFQDAARDLRKVGLEPAIATAYLDPEDGKIRVSAAFYSAGGRDWDIQFDLTVDQYSDAAEKWKSKGFRVRHVSAYDTPDGPRFLATAIREKDPTSSIAYSGLERHGLTGPQYQKEFDRLADDGYTPVCVCGYREGREIRFAAVWQKKIK